MKIRLSVLTALLVFATSFAQDKKWTLNECVDYALENNINIKKNKKLVEISEVDIIDAKGNFLPNLGASIRGNFNSGLSPDQEGILKNTNNFSSSYGLSTGGTIFNGYRNLNIYKQAKLGVEASKLDLQKIEDDISLFVVNAYLNILFAKENLEVAQTQLEISQKQIEVTQAQVDAGVKPKGDLLDAESTVAADAQNVVTQENALDLALLSLAQLLQVSPDNFDVAIIDVGSPSIATLYENSNMVYEKALENRAEIARAKLAVDNADLNIKIAKGAYLPTLSYNLGASTSYFYQFNNLLPNQMNAGFSDQFSDRFQYSGGLSLNIPIFNRNQTRANINKSIINKKISEFDLADQKLQLKETIERAYLDAKAAAKSYEVAKISLDAQQEAFKNAEERYNLEAMTSFEFDQVRSRLVDAESTLIRAKYDYVFKTKVLEFYFGEEIVLE
ncbi:TolC family protein [Aureibaculum sp. 2210JD6-5]|uniref:TolC family protein n=1 Tax=Aureibaculum sp. 2210JD6-5 TaxID=3103957 RepID=UPI002AAD31EC|nr:TolC family protein [Aureibaculum sp. 2210JD6-5]MDY7396237.1 TolC family protein [Aureibaculum sp. 2210JD6-5]